MKIKRLISKYLKPNNIYLGDCLDLMSKINANSVDMIYADLPYGDIIPIDKMWFHFKRIIKFHGAIVLHTNQPFTSKLIMSNIDMFKYCWVWDKTNLKLSFLYNNNYKPIKAHEDIIIFSFSPAEYTNKDKYLSNMKYIPQTNYGHPCSVMRFDIQNEDTYLDRKPTSLIEYFIRTYTDKNDIVLDCWAGKGSIGVVCKNINRRYILIEKEIKYYNIAKKILGKN